MNFVGFIAGADFVAFNWGCSDASTSLDDLVGAGTTTGLSVNFGLDDGVAIWLEEGTRSCASYCLLPSWRPKSP